ncbi:MAG TPA: hypothetical protein VJU84_15610 [Pyrinomonadaceae bacterium]|nr:hypothetical protein [Pyrinomonadaceae bacterium]
MYSAYINALIDGRPRRNDPSTGQDHTKKNPLPESLFSVQFAPAYVIALIAQVLGASASTAFIVLTAVAALLSSAAIFWLLVSVTGDSKLAGVGVIIVLCLGALVGGQGWVGILFRPGAIFSGLPFLRRYLPAAPFPLFFVFCTLVWHALTTSLPRKAISRGLLAGITFGGLVFSYFYLWTAALAWLFGVSILWLVFRAADWRRILIVCFSFGLPSLIVFTFYSYLLSGLPSGLNQAQVLVPGHSPDVWRVPQAVGVLSLIALSLGAWFGKFDLKSPPIIFASSFALLPLLVFNQQIITGRSIQSYHYEVFIINYAVLLGLVILLKILTPAISRRKLFGIAAVCFLWGVIEVNQSFVQRSTRDVRNDEAVPVLRNLRALAQDDGTLVGLREKGKAPILVFAPRIEISTMLPTWAPQGSLLAIGSVSFQSLSRADRTTSLFMHLHYCGHTSESFRELLGRDNRDFLAYYAKSTLFGPERVWHFLTPHFQPLTATEVEGQVRAYQSFIDSFAREVVLKRPLGYAITSSSEEWHFSHIDKWYERDAGERVGNYNLYRLTLRRVHGLSVD